MANNENISQAALELKKEYFRNWRKNNKDKVRRYNNAYWQKRALKEQQAKTH